MKKISVKIEGEEAEFYWKDGKVYCEGYDLESERNVLALTGFGEGIGVLLVALNDSCKSEAEFRSEINAFVAGHEELIARNFEQDYWPEGQLLFEYFSYSPDSTIRWGGLEDAHLSERHYKRLGTEKDMGIKERMARLSELPEKYFHALANLPSLEIKYRLADNEKCPSDVLEILSKDEDAYVRRYVAENPSCSEGILEGLAKDKEEWVRGYIPTNPNCTEGILEILAKDDDATIRRSVARNLTCPARILEILAHDENAQVRIGVTTNSKCPQRIIETLAQDKNIYVREASQKRIAMSPGLET